MSHLFKCIGGVLGWALGEWLGGIYGWRVGGIAGAVLGFIAGTMVDSFEIRFFDKQVKKTTMGNFAAGLLVIIAATMKADGHVVKAELNYVKQFLKRNFGEREAVEALAALQQILKQKLPLDDALMEIRNHLDQSDRFQFTHFLYNLATIDRPMNEAEQNILNIIDNALKVHKSKERTVGRMDVQEKEIAMAYGTLGIRRDDSIIDIKKAYRTLANQCHPDKVAFLGDEQKRAAKDKFQRLTQAYEIIKKERRFN